MPDRNVPIGQLAIEQEAIVYLVRHAQISIGFQVDRVLELTLPGGSGLQGMAFTETQVKEPWWKDYDTCGGEGPTAWPERFDVSNWGLMAGYLDHERVAGAVIACLTPGLELLEGRDELAVLWDLRVAPDVRGWGIGSALLKDAMDWAKTRGCRELKVETQNINFPACRFYARHGFTLGAINRHAYPDLADEIQLFWYRSL